jgi:hypothetical protein
VRFYRVFTSVAIVRMAHAVFIRYSDAQDLRVVMNFLSCDHGSGCTAPTGIAARTTEVVPDSTAAQPPVAADEPAPAALALSTFEPSRSASLTAVTIERAVDGAATGGSDTLEARATRRAHAPLALSS